MEKWNRTNFMEWNRAWNKNFFIF